MGADAECARPLSRAFSGRPRRRLDPARAGAASFVLRPRHDPADACIGQQGSVRGSAGARPRNPRLGRPARNGAARGHLALRHERPALRGNRAVRAVQKETARGDRRRADERDGVPVQLHPEGCAGPGTAPDRRYIGQRPYGVHGEVRDQPVVGLRCPQPARIRNIASVSPPNLASGRHRAP